jgi:hypothetical protein
VFAERLGDITGWNKFPALTLLSSEPGNSYERLSQLSHELEWYKKLPRGIVRWRNCTRSYSSASVSWISHTRSYSTNAFVCCQSTTRNLE